MMAPLPKGCGYRGRRTARAIGGVVLIEFGLWGDGDGGSLWRSASGVLGGVSRPSRLVS